MTFTYTDTIPTDLDAVRFELGDTISAQALFTDEEIMYKLGTMGHNLMLTCAELCKQLAVRFARQADFQIDNQAVKLSQKAQAYRQMALDFIARNMNGITVNSVTKIDGYQPIYGPIPDSQSRVRQTAPLSDYDIGRWDTGGQLP